MYYSYNCSFEQTLTPAITQPSLTWRTDVLLETPQLLYPRDDAVLCFERTGGGTGIVLEWDGVAGATHYLVQWGGNPQLAPPTMREVMIAAPTVSYELQEEDIRLGETVYWRIIAINRTTGGVSAKSQQRKLTYNCGDQSDSEGIDLCSEYDVQLEIKGTDYASCCDANTFWLQLSYKKQDQFGNTLVDVAGISWEVDTDPDSDGSAIIRTLSEGDKKAIIETCGDYSQVFKISVFVLFNDYVNGGEFECEASKLVFMDCDTPFHERPWSGNQANCNTVCLHKGYFDQYPWGLLYNPCEPGDSGGGSNCDDVCLGLEGEDNDSIVVNGVTITAELDFVTVCPGESITISGTLQYTGNPIPPEPVEVTFDPFGCGAPDSDTIYQVSATPVPYTFTYDFSGGSCECSFGFVVNVGGSTSSIFFDFTGAANEVPVTENTCHLSSYENIVVATGPVFKIPIGCSSGIYTECCDCVPETIGFYMDSGSGAGHGLLRYSKEASDSRQVPVWNSFQTIPAFDSNPFFFNHELYCQYDYWHFNTTFSPATCDFLIGCGCVPKEFPVLIDWEHGDESGSTTINFFISIDGTWGISDGDLALTPSCGEPFTTSFIILDFGFGESCVGFSDDSTWEYSCGSLTLSSCSPFAGFADVVVTNPNCDDLILLMTWNVENECDICAEGEISAAFQACNPVYEQFQLDYADWPNPVNVTIGTDTYCQCGSDTVGGAYALEARINIPISCHFKVVNGQLALNLENLLGPGIGIAVNPETGCEYLYSYGGATFLYTIIYCCYTPYEDMPL